MSTIVNLTSILGTDGQTMSAGDSSWVLHPLYTGSATIISGRAYQTAIATNSLYLRAETPLSANQVVTAGIYHLTAGDAVINVVARASSAANTFFLAQYFNGSVKLFKFVAGTVTQLGTTTAVTAPSAGTSKTLTLSVTGASPSINVVLSWNSVAVITQTVNDTNLDGIGKIGVRFGTSTFQSSGTAGINLSSFSATDDYVSGDTTPPTLTSPTATATGSSTATGSVSTNEANGTLYYLASVNATETATTVKAGSSQSVTATGTQSVSVTGLTGSTSYYLHFLHRDASGNDSTVVTSAQFTTSVADTTPPVLTGTITVTSITQTSYTLSWPTGSDNIAVTAYEYSLNAGSTWTSNGTSTTVNITGRTASTTDSVQVRAKDAAGNVSTPVLSTSVTLLDPTYPRITTPPLKNNTGTLLSGETGVVVNVYNTSTGALVLQKTGLTSDSSGIVTFVDVALSASATYAYEVVLTGGRRRLPLVLTT